MHCFLKVLGCSSQFDYFMLYRNFVYQMMLISEVFAFLVKNTHKMIPKYTFSTYLISNKTEETDKPNIRYDI
jgi:hypothetical protein